jgi:hypothetical protein
MNAWNQPKGTEEVIVCRDCRERSDRDLRGRNGFTLVLRGGGAIPVCNECAAIEKFGQVGLMAVLIRETQGRRAVRKLQKLELVAPATQLQRVRIVCCSAPVVAEPTEETWYV